MPDLFPRRTVIDGKTAADDYTVFTAEGDSVGRIKRRDGNPKHTDPWSWNINPPFPIPAYANGTAASLEDAKIQFKAAWVTFRASISDERWERIMAPHRNKA